MYPSIGKKIREYRKERGLTQDELAEKVNLSPNHMGAIERAEKNLTLATLINIANALDALADEERYGVILRAKGIVAGVDGQWIHFDYGPGDVDVRFGGADVIGKLCVIGAAIKEDALKSLFGI